MAKFLTIGLSVSTNSTANCVSQASGQVWPENGKRLVETTGNQKMATTNSMKKPNHGNRTACSRSCTQWTSVLTILLLCTTLGLCLPVAAANQADAAVNYQDANDLRQTAMLFLEEQVAKANGRTTQRETDISVGHIDNRLRLTHCQDAPQAFLSAGTRLQGKLTIGLRCSGPRPWTVYIPAHIKVFADVVTAAHPLRRGAEISQDDVITIRQELGQLHNDYFVNADDVVGKIIKQNINAGQAISAKRIKAPIVVRRGDAVSIIVTAGRLKVKMKGKALKDAAVGDRLTVRNGRSKRIVQGIAVASGVVSVRM